MNIFEYIILLIACVVIFSLGHELIHYLTAKALNMKVKIIPKWWGFYVYLANTSGKRWNELEKKAKVKYNLIAISPYILFIPLFFILTIISNSNLLCSISTILLIVNLISLPMEWIVK